MAEENTQAVDETEIEEGEIVELDPVEEEQPKTEIPVEPVDEEAEAVIENGSANGTVSFQFAQYADNAAPTIIKQGSFVEVQRF